MKKIFLVVFTCFITNLAYAEVKIGFVQVDQILKNAPQTAASNKKLEKEFKKRTDALKQAIVTIQKEEKDFAKNSLTLSDTEKEKISRKLQQQKIDAKRDERELREDIDIRRREEINELQTQVKIHGVVFPTLMLIEIVDKFVEDKPKRENKTPDERHVQEGFDRVSAKWMGKTN